MRLPDGAETQVFYKTPFQSTPHLVVAEFRESWFNEQPYSKMDFTFPKQEATYFVVHNNHAEQYFGAWATIKWRAEGVRAPEKPASPSASSAVLAQGGKTKQELFIAAVKKLGGTVGVDSSSPDNPVISIDLHGTKITDAELVPLQQCTSLRTLNLYGTKVTDAGMVYLRGLAQLQTLYLNDTSITDAGLANLQDLTNLKELGLYRTRITDSGLAHLKRLRSLQQLALSGKGITDQGLVYLQGLTNLRELVLLDTRVSSRAVQDLQKALPKARIVM